MRSLLLALALLLPAPLAAQAVHPATVPLYMGRAVFATRGVETMPLMYVDEQALQPERFVSYPVPAKYWEQAKACAAAQGYDVSKAGEAPTVLVIPAVRTIKVHDMTIDSILYAEDPQFVGEHWADPTVGYSLVRSGYVLLTQTYRMNPYVLRHESLHFIVWRSTGELGHPDKAFIPCDKNYEER